jgi:hypothetical protein
MPSLFTNAGCRVSLAGSDYKPASLFWNRKPINYTLDDFFTPGLSPKRRFDRLADIVTSDVKGPIPYSLHNIFDFAYSFHSGILNKLIDK